MPEATKRWPAWRHRLVPRILAALDPNPAPSASSGPLLAPAAPFHATAGPSTAHTAAEKRSTKRTKTGASKVAAPALPGSGEATDIEEAAGATRQEAQRQTVLADTPVTGAAHDAERASDPSSSMRAADEIGSRSPGNADSTAGRDYARREHHSSLPEDSVGEAVRGRHLGSKVHHRDEHVSALCRAAGADLAWTGKRQRSQRGQRASQLQLPTPHGRLISYAEGNLSARGQHGSARGEDGPEFAANPCDHPSDGIDRPAEAEAEDIWQAAPVEGHASGCGPHAHGTSEIEGVIVQKVPIGGPNCGVSLAETTAALPQAAMVTSEAKMASAESRPASLSHEGLQPEAGAAAVRVPASCGQERHASKSPAHSNKENQQVARGSRSSARVRKASTRYLGL